MALGPPLAALAAPSQPACASDPGSWCTKVYQLTHADWLARSANAVVGHGLSILVIVVVAFLLRRSTHRAISRLTRCTAAGRPPAMLRPLPERAPAMLRPLRERAAAKLRAAAPAVVERRSARAATIGSVLRSAATFVIYGSAFVMVLGEFGIDLAPIIASAGVVGVALGFGAQNLIRDFLSGMFMMLEDQYGVGDVVDLGQATGTVEAVGLRMTTLRDVSGTVWYVRNGEVLRVGNSSQGYAVAVVDVPLAHTADVDTATRVVAAAADELMGEKRYAPDVLEPPEMLGVQSVTPDTVTLRLTVKTRPGRQWGVQRALNGAVKTALDEANLPAPYPAGRTPGLASGDAAAP